MGQYGIGALLSTGHAVVVTDRVLFRPGLDFFPIKHGAALLLWPDYSINETVVVFERIRETRRQYKRMS